MKGGAPRAVWLVLYADPMLVSARCAAERLNQAGRPCHLVWNPLSGEMAQLIPAVRAARALGWRDWPGSADGPAWRLAQRTGCRPVPRLPSGNPATPAARDGLPSVNTEGRICLQIGVIGQAWAPFTDGPVARLQEIVSWLDSWEIPRGWPAGRPTAFPASGTGGLGRASSAQQSRRNWARGGHFGCSQVPGSGCPGPGAIDIDRLTSPQPVPATAGPLGSPARISAMTAQPWLMAARSAMP
jgi:hypothetical protein